MTEEQECIAQEMYQRYDFGENVIVVDQNGWESDGSPDFTRIVFVEFDDSPAESSHSISFHVKFKDNQSLEIEEVYGLLMSSGNEIGHLPESEKKNKNKPF